jgi:hypothetical protein
MNDSEYDDYTPEHPELIPADETEANASLLPLLDVQDLAAVDTRTFLRGWWALAWLFPCLHPDDSGEWSGDMACYRPLAHEAFRREREGLIDDGELYAAEAVHRRVWLEREG